MEQLHHHPYSHRHPSLLRVSAGGRLEREVEPIQSDPGSHQLRSWTLRLAERAMAGFGSLAEFADTEEAWVDE